MCRLSGTRASTCRTDCPSLQMDGCVQHGGRVKGWGDWKLPCLGSISKGVLQSASPMRC